MKERDPVARSPGTTIAISDTGPLISAFQSSSFELLTELFEWIAISTASKAELTRHGWQDKVEAASPVIVIFELTPEEEPQAKIIAAQIAQHPESDDPVIENHLGEAQAIVLAMRQEFQDDILLLDELAARAVARKLNVNLSGFAGVLLLAVRAGLITPMSLRQRLETCRTQGTHYSLGFIASVFELAQREWSRT